MAGVTLEDGVGRCPECAGRFSLFSPQKYRAGPPPGLIKKWSIGPVMIMLTVSIIALFGDAPGWLVRGLLLSTLAGAAVVPIASLIVLTRLYGPDDQRVAFIR